MLGKPRNEFDKSYTESGFQGHLTKVQVWERALHVTNEIQKQVRDCRTEPVLYQGLILTWAGYDDITGGVERVVPSHCGQRVCPLGYSGNRCQQLEADKIPPKIEHCPGDLWVIAKNGSSIVTWDDPQFTDNVGIVRVQEKSGHRSGQTLLWGTYDISYVAYDQAGNSASCDFKVYVLCKYITGWGENVSFFIFGKSKMRIIIMIIVVHLFSRVLSRVVGSNWRHTAVQGLGLGRSIQSVRDFLQLRLALLPRSSQVLHL